MPWKVVKRDKKWVVVKKYTGEPVKGGMHKTRKEAVAHMRALYANVDDVGKDNKKKKINYKKLLKIKS